MADERKMDVLARDFNELSRMFAAMNEQVRQIGETQREEKTSAGNHRRELRGEVNALRMEQAHSQLQMVGIKSDVADVKTDVAEVKGDVSAMQGKIDTYEDARLQALGASKIVVILAKLIYAIGGAALVGVGWLASLVFSGQHPIK